MELLGANIAANGSREQMSYTIDCLRSHVPAALELLADCVVNPAFDAGELEEQKGRLAMLLAAPEVQLTLLTEVCTWPHWASSALLLPALGCCLLAAGACLLPALACCC